MSEDHNESVDGRPAKPFAAKKPSSALLPNIESPPLSPANEGLEAPRAALAKGATTAPRVTGTTVPRSALRRRRNAMLSAWAAGMVTLGVLAGMAIGAVLVAPTAGAPNRFADRKSVQQELAGLHQDIAVLKARLATAEQAAAQATTAAISAEPSPDFADVTGSIPAMVVDAPLPPPRPTAASRQHLVRGWSIRYVRDGFVYVQGLGSLYQAQLGAPLPGLGPVQEVQQRDGRWTVLTPKGLIVSLRDRRHFEQF